MRAASLGSVYVYYNLACLYSLNGHYDEAMTYIERAAAHGTLPSIVDMQHDEWLEGLRGSKQFRNYLAQLANRDKQ